MKFDVNDNREEEYFEDKGIHAADGFLIHEHSRKKGYREPQKSKDKDPILRYVIKQTHLPFNPLAGSSPSPATLTNI